MPGMGQGETLQAAEALLEPSVCSLVPKSHAALGAWERTCQIGELFSLPFTPLVVPASSATQHTIPLTVFKSQMINYIFGR